jgi:hypothetical protein
VDQEAAYRYLTEDPASPKEPLLVPGDLSQRESPLAAAKYLMDKFQEALTLDENLSPSFPPPE